MAARLPLALQWRVNGHICRACRQHLLASHSPRRNYSSSAAQAVSESNDIPKGLGFVQSRPKNNKKGTQAIVQASDHVAPLLSNATSISAHGSDLERTESTPRIATEQEKKWIEQENARQKRLGKPGISQSQGDTPGLESEQSDNTLHILNGEEKIFIEKKIDRRRKRRLRTKLSRQRRARASADSEAVKPATGAQQGGTKLEKQSVKEQSMTASDTASEDAPSPHSEGAQEVPSKPPPARKVLTKAKPAKPKKARSEPRPGFESVRKRNRQIARLKTSLGELRTITEHTVETAKLDVKPLPRPAHPEIPTLSHGLERVLFNTGVHFLQDPHSKVFNFDPYLQHIMPVQEFDFGALKEYKTSSEDSTLTQLAQEHGKKYTGSTSSMCAVLAHFHFLLSSWRSINLGMLSRSFPERRASFTRINRAPVSIILRWRNGTYAIDASKDLDSPNVLMMLGKSMEKLLTLSEDDYERYRRGDERQIPQEERDAPEAFQYSTMGDLLMRSQLDSQDSRLPGEGTFDLKTRSVLPIRMSAKNPEPMLGYEITTMFGAYNSYEREYYDMLRSTMLKYMLQARMGRMDGIFLAYHNIERLFGFQYIPMHEIDLALHGQSDSCLGDQEFRLSLRILNDILNAVTLRWPERSIRMHFETAEPRNAHARPSLHFWAEPVSEQDLKATRIKTKAKFAAYERRLAGLVTELPDHEAGNGEAASADAHKDTIEAAAGPEAATPTPASDAAPADTIQHDPSSATPELEAQSSPLLAGIVNITSKVNGKPVNAPGELKPSDKWQVKYTIEEMSDVKRAQASYAAAKARRFVALHDADEKEDIAGADADTVSKSKDSGYIAMLKAMAARGRQIRRELNEKEKGVLPVLLRTQVRT